MSQGSKKSLPRSKSAEDNGNLTKEIPQPETGESLMKVLKDLMENRKVNDGIVEAFIRKERFNRGDLIALKLIVDAYDRLDDENVQLEVIHFLDIIIFSCLRLILLYHQTRQGK